MWRGLIILLLLFIFISCTSSEEDNIVVKEREKRPIYIYSGIPGYNITNFRVGDSLLFSRLCYGADTVIGLDFTGEISFYLESESGERIQITKDFSDSNYWNISPKALDLYPITFDATVIE
jgi:hypothetical protein